MKFLPLMWSGIGRKPGRTVLIFLQVCVAFALFGVLQGLHGAISLIDPLPLSLLEQIRSVPGVKIVVPVELFGAVYQNPSQKLGIVAIRPDAGWVSAFTYTIAPEYVAAFHNIRTGALIRTGLTKKDVSLPVRSVRASMTRSRPFRVRR